MKIIDEQINFSNFYHNQSYSEIANDLLDLRPPKYISSSINLQRLGYPSKYGVIFGVTDNYKLGDNTCQIFDVIGPIPLSTAIIFHKYESKESESSSREEENIELNFTITTPWDVYLYDLYM